MATTTKVIRYFRCLDDNEPFDIEHMVRYARQSINTVASSEWRQADEVIRIQHYREEDNGVLLHFVRYVPGESSDTLLPGAQGQEDNEEPHPAPRGMEYKDGDFFMYCRDHNIIGTSHGRSMHHSKIEQYLKHYLRIGTIDEEDVEGVDYDFHISTALNLEKYRIIERHGVSKVGFSASAYSASYYNGGYGDTWLRRFMAQGAEAIRHRLEGYDDETELGAMEDIIIEGTIRLKGNTRADEFAKSELREIAEESIEDGGIVIYTHNNEKLRSSDIRLQTKEVLNKFGKSVYYDDVWNKMKSYYAQLERDHLLGQ